MQNALAGRPHARCLQRLVKSTTKKMTKKMKKIIPCPLFLPLSPLSLSPLLAFGILSIERKRQTWSWMECNLLKMMVVNIFKWPTELFQITIILVVSVDKSINKKTKVKKEKKTKMFTKINQFYKLDNQRAPFRTSTLGPNYPGSRAQSAATGLHSRRPVIKSSSTNTNLSLCCGAD